MITIDGRTYSVPDVYGAVEVINLGSVALPSFNTLLTVGSARKGIPYSASTGDQVIKAFTNSVDAINYYGKSPLTDGLQANKDGGAGVVYTLNVAPLTKGSAIIKDNATTPANTMKLVPKQYGAGENDISITIATVSNTTTVTIVPAKLTKFLKANAATSNKNISLEEVSGLQVGQTVLINTNAVASPQSTTITAIDPVNNIVSLADAPAAAYATSDYARIFQEDLDNQEVFTFDATNVIDDVIAKITTGQNFIATRETYTGVVPTTLTKTYFQNISGATKGTSPIATETVGGDFDLAAAALPKLIEEFMGVTKSRIRIVNVISSTASVHAAYLSLAKTMRANQLPIQVVVGCALGDIALATSDAGNPIKRAKSLNNQDVILVGMGRDDKAAYISLAPYFAGMMSASSVKKNLTWDAVSAIKVEKMFGLFNRETETANYVKAGVVVIGTSKNGFYVVQAVNTYQNNATVWNQADAMTYLIQQRQIVDYVYAGYKDQMESGVGADGYGITEASVGGQSILQKYLNGGFITYAAIKKAYREGNAIITEPEITPLDATDFVGFILRVVVNS
jgi:hypothetical protein